MYLRVTYEQEFDDLIMYLKSKYPKELFDLDGIGEQTDMSKFSRKFFSANVTADASIDANANVDDVSVIAYNIELPKPFFKLNSYYILWEQLKKDYDLETANKIIEMQLTGDIYIHDFHGVGAGMPYCFNYSTYDIALQGLPMVKKIKSKPPKHLYAFKSQLEQFITQAANSTLGATGLADTLIIMSKYVKDILATKKDAHFKFETREDVWEYVKETLVSFIYTINQPMRANQCVTEDTEVLTTDGWKNKNELKIGDDIYTWNDGKMNIQKVQMVNIYDYEGEIHRYEGRDYVQEVSPNHRVLRKEFNREGYKLQMSNELIDFKTPITMPVAFKDNDLGGIDLTDEEIMLLVFTLTEGNIKHGEGNRRDRISIFKSPNRWGNNKLRNIFDKLNIKYTKSYIRSKLGDYKINIYRLMTEDAQKYIKLLNHTKKEIPNFLLNMNKRQAKLFLNTWARLDGSHERLRLQCDNEKIRDRLQHIAVIAGYGSTKNERTFTDISDEHEVEGLYLHLYKRKDKDASKKIKSEYKGKIWCPTTKDGIVVFRKEGKVFISGNSPFSNISIFDDYFLDGMINDYRFPDGNNPDKEITKKLQFLFIDIMNEELRRTPITFPVTTACFSVEDGEIRDKKFLHEVSKRNVEFGFINIYIGKSSTLSSCCRLRSDTDNEYFNSFGSGSSKIGSLGVVTINLPRLAMNSKKEIDFLNKIKEMTDVAAKINNAKRKIVQKRIDNGNHPLYALGFMSIKRQYSTVGINGLYETLSMFGYDVMQEDGQEFAIKIMKQINNQNDNWSEEFGYPHNCEQVPAENASIKMVSKDRLMGYNPEVDMYSNQFVPLTDDIDIIDRLEVQGKFDKHFSGGAIAHANVMEKIESTETMERLIEIAAQLGVVYFAINYNLQECEKGHMQVGKHDNCNICGAKIAHNYTRVVGFLTDVGNWHQKRREEDYPQRVWK